jgi:S-adenosylmethionine synthetase
MFELNTNALSGTYNYTCNTTGNANYSNYTTNKNLLVYMSGALMINAVYDENSLTPLTFNLTIYNDTFSTQYINLTNYNNNTVRGYLTLAISSNGYVARKYYVNATGRFLIGGPVSDTGFTGRKLLVDTYGGVAAPGGGAFSGKDPTKVDRSAAYMVRYIAKNIVAAGLADKCLIHIAYVIGKADPLAIMVDTSGTGKLSEQQFIKLIQDNFELRPQGMIKSLDLLRPIYRKTACYGHFGRTEPEFSWESTDKAATLKKQAARL